ncbi:MAG: 23S rRNA (guanosine(2251)-2'-O)-methyltransferase RlmB, partial [Acidimicrobiales bacterium]
PQGTSGARSGRGRAPGAGRNAKRAPKRALGGDQVEGRQAVRELLLAGTRQVREIYMIEDLDAADILDDIVELAQDMRIPLRAVSRRHFDAEALTESHQGVLARAAELPEHDLDDLAQKPGAFLLVLDGITDPGNVGAMLRTAECAGVTGIVLPRHRAVHVSPTVTKIAAGAIEHLPMALVPGIPAALQRLQDLGVLTVGLDMGGETSIFQLPLTHQQPVALVLGAEGKGLSRLVRERVDLVAQIPMAGSLNSLNVAMASAVACFEVVRQRASTATEEAP